MSDLFQKYKLIIYLFFTVLIGEVLVAAGVMSISVVKTQMRKRCRSDLHPDEITQTKSTMSQCRQQFPMVDAVLK